MRLEHRRWILLTVADVLTHLTAWFISIPKISLLSEKVWSAQLWASQLNILFALSLLLSMVCHFGKWLPVLYVSFTARFILVILFSGMLADRMFAYAPLFMLFVLEAIIYLPAMAAVIFCFISVAGWVQLRLVHGPAFDYQPPGLEIAELLQMSSQLTVAATAGLLLHRQQRALDRALLERDQLEHAVDNLSEMNVNLQEYAATADVQAVERDRNRLMREMHDTVGHALSSVIMMLEVAKQMSAADQEATVRQINLTTGVVHDCLLEVRRLIKGLKPSPLEQERGLAAIKKLAETCMHNTGVEIVVSYGDVPLCTIPPELEVVMYRIVQEGLTNALRHGFAHRVDISTRLEKGGLNVRVRDDGSGCPALSEGSGLTGLRQRVAEVGGKLRIQTEAGQGFLLDVWLPLEADSLE
ncbi:MAG: sensor histidine kinase [Bacteroidota bacterium]